MTFDSQQQKDDILGYVSDEKLRKEISNAKVVAPWVPEHDGNLHDAAYLGELN